MLEAQKSKLLNAPRGGWTKPRHKSGMHPFSMSVLIIYSQILSVLTSCLSFRSLTPRGMNHSSQHHRPQNGLLPSPPLLPPPPFYPPMEAPPLHRPYRQSDSQWRRPPRSEDSRPRYPSAEPNWRPSSWQQEDRRRGPPPPRPLPRYSPRWTNESSGHDAPDEQWAGPRMRHDHRHTHRHRADKYDNC